MSEVVSIDVGSLEKPRPVITTDSVHEAFTRTEEATDEHVDSFGTVDSCEYTSGFACENRKCISDSTKVDTGQMPVTLYPPKERRGYLL